MKSNHILLITTVLSFVGCSKINQTDNNSEQYAEKECEVLKMYLEDKRYVFPTRDEFKKSRFPMSLQNP